MAIIKTRVDIFFMVSSSQIEFEIYNGQSCDKISAKKVKREKLAVMVENIYKIMLTNAWSHDNIIKCLLK